MDAGLTGPRGLALPTRAPIPQKLPGINSQLVPIIEMKLDRVLSYAVGRRRFYGRLKHRERAPRKFRRLSWLLVGLAPLLVAQGARTSIPQEWKGIMRLMSILPFDVETCPCAQVHLDRLRVRHCRHEFSIAQQTLAFLRDLGSLRLLPGTA